MRIIIVCILGAALALQAHGLNAQTKKSVYGKIQKISEAMARRFSCDAVCFSPSGEKIAVGAKNGYLKVVDRNLKEIVLIPSTNFGRGSGHITGLGWLTDDLLVACAYDGTISAFHVSDESGNYQAARQYRLLNYTDKIINWRTAGEIGKERIKAWKQDVGMTEAEMNGPHSSSIFSAKVEQFRLQGNELQDRRGAPSYLDLALWRSAEPWVVIVSKDKSLERWTLGANQRCESVTREGGLFEPYRVKITVDGRYIVCAGGYSKVFILDAQTMAVITHFSWRQFERSYDVIRALDIRPHTPEGILQVAVGSDRGYGALFKVDLNSVGPYDPAAPKLFGTDDGVEISRFQLDPNMKPPVKARTASELVPQPTPGDDRAHKHRIQALRFTLDGRYLITAGGINNHYDPINDEHYIRIWDVETGRLVKQMPPQGWPEAFTAMDVSPQGDCFVAVTDERNIYKIPLNGAAAGSE